MIRSHAIGAEGSANWWVVAGGFLALMLLAVCVWTRPRSSFVLVVAKPFGFAPSALALVAQTDGAVVSGGRVPWLAVAHSDSLSFSARLRDAGAILVLDAGLLSLCHQETAR